MGRRDRLRAYVGIKLLAGRVREISPAMAILAVLFIVHFAVG